MNKPSPRRKRNDRAVEASLRDLAAEAAALRAALGEDLADQVADWLLPQYVQAARAELAQTATAQQRWRVLQAMVNDVSALRRGDHSAQRLELERDWLELERSKTRESREREFEQWLERPDLRKRLGPEAGLTADEKAARIRAIYGLSRPDPDDQPT